MKKKYDEVFYKDHHATKVKGAEIVLRKLFKSLPKIESAVDIGCGVGTWLSVFKELGVNEIRGYDGPWVNKKMLKIPEECFTEIELDKNFFIDKKYDLAMSLEVAEHLPESSAELFVETLTKASDIILFSAAIPLQGGVNHFNEQWPEYGSELFNKKEYVTMDILRMQIWNEEEVLSFYKQNILLYVNKDVIKKIKIPVPVSILSMVHPDFYLYKIRSIPYEIRLTELYKIVFKRILKKIAGKRIWNAIKKIREKNV
ncbi:MAG: class I SAM-dependent methyltransferase [Fibromonadaceae bacterium]|jgi:hypothetical protein|nr:class I SAM-dependent methyltransferase [Fibromonadaceae bacterium]